MVLTIETKVNLLVAGAILLTALAIYGWWLLSNKIKRLEE
jgi:hypothetical protein